jgi:hypothetical protein
MADWHPLHNAIEVAAGEWWMSDPLGAPYAACSRPQGRRTTPRLDPVTKIADLRASHGSFGHDDRADVLEQLLGGGTTVGGARSIEYQTSSALSNPDLVAAVRDG